MAESRDGYDEWLGVSTASRPLNHYELFGLGQFEGDGAKIALAADAALARVRRCQPGSRVAEWQQILDELSMAKLVLCNGARKGQYDGQLRSRLGSRPSPRSAAATPAASESPSRGAGAPAGDNRSGAGDPVAVPPQKSPASYAMPPGPPNPAPIAAAPPNAQPQSYAPPGAPATNYPSSSFPAAAYPPSSFPAASYPAAGAAAQAPSMGYQYPAAGMPTSAAPNASYFPPQPQYQGYPATAPQPTIPSAPAPQVMYPQNQFPQRGQYPQQNQFPQQNPYPQSQFPQGQYPVQVAQPQQPIYAQPGMTPSAQPNVAPAYGRPQPGVSPGGATPYDATPYVPTPAPYPGSVPTAPSTDPYAPVAMQPYPPAQAPVGAAASEPNAIADQPSALTQIAPPPAESGLAVARSPVGLADKVIVRTSSRPAGPSAAEVRAEQQRAALELAKANQRKYMIIGSVAAALLIMVVIVMSSSGGPVETAEDPALKDRQHHKNPLGDPHETKKTGPIVHQRPVVDFSAATPSAKSPKSDPPQPSAEPMASVGEAPATPKTPKSPKHKPSPEGSRVKPDAAPSEMSEPEKPSSKTAPAPNGMAAGEMPQTADPEKAAALDKELLKARGALAARNVMLARDSLAAAEILAQTQEQHDRLEQLRLLTQYVDGFWREVRKSMAALQLTDELKIGSTPVAVVSADENEVVLHRGGKNETFKVETMPLGVVNMLADRWFHQTDPVNKVYLGAFQAVDPNGELADARRLWEDASRSGLSKQVQPLMSLLDMPRVAPIAGAAAARSTDGKPNKVAIAQAEREFNKKYGPEIRAADDTNKKLELADQLLSEFKLAEEPVEETVLFREVCKLVSSACLVAKDETSAQSAASKAIAIVDLGLEEQRFDPQIKTLSTSAASAARKAKDDDLIAQATDRSHKVIAAFKNAPR